MTFCAPSPSEAPQHPFSFRLRRFANWFPLGLTYATLAMGRYDFNVYGSHARELHGLTDGDVGIIATAGFWVYAASLVVNGPLTERIGGRRALLVGVAGSSALNLAIALFLRGPAAKGHVVLGLSLLYGANMYFQSFGAVAVVKINSAWFHWRERGLFGGVFGSMISLGYYLALGIGGLVYAHLPFWALFLVPSLGLAVMLPVDARLVRDRPGLAGLADFDTGDGPRGLPGRDAHRARETRALGVRQGIGRVLSHPVLRLLACAELCTGVVRQGLLLYLGRFLAQVHGVTETATPRRYQAATLGIAVGGICGALLCGVLSDRVFASRRAPVAFLFYAGQVVALIALGRVTSSYVAVGLVGFACVWIFGVHGMLSATASMDFGGRSAAATAAGLLDGVQYLGSGLVGFGLGSLMDRYHWALWPYALLPFSVVGGLLMLKLWNATPARVGAH